jgi:hypothetical protein
MSTEAGIPGTPIPALDTQATSGGTRPVLPILKG